MIIQYCKIQYFIFFNKNKSLSLNFNLSPNLLALRIAENILLMK